MCVSLTGKIVVGPSNLSKYLVVKALHDKEPIIGQCVDYYSSVFVVVVVVVVFFSGVVHVCLQGWTQ